MWFGRASRLTGALYRFPKSPQDPDATGRVEALLDNAWSVANLLRSRFCCQFGGVFGQHGTILTFPPPQMSTNPITERRLFRETFCPERIQRRSTVLS